MRLGIYLQVCTILSTSHIIFVSNRSNFVIRLFISKLKTILLCASDTCSDYKDVDELSAYHKKNYFKRHKQTKILFIKLPWAKLSDTLFIAWVSEVFAASLAPPDAKSLSNFSPPDGLSFVLFKVVIALLSPLDL